MTTYTEDTFNEKEAFGDSAWSTEPPMFDRDAFMDVVIPTIFFDAKEVAAFYTRWLTDNDVKGTISVQRIAPHYPWFQRLLARDVVVRADLTGMAGDAIIKVYRKMDMIPHAEELRKDMQRKQLQV